MFRRWIVAGFMSVVVGCGGKPAGVKTDDPVQVLGEIQAWIRTNAPPLAGVFNPPATEEAIAAFESRRKVKMPPAVRALYLRHDGEARNKSDGVFGCWRWMPLSELDEATLLTEDGRIPLLVSGGGDMYYVKSHNAAAPDEKLYEWWHEKPEQAAVIAPSVTVFMQTFHTRLSRGEYVFKPNELNALVDLKDLN